MILAISKNLINTLTTKFGVEKTIATSNCLTVSAKLLSLVSRNQTLYRVLTYTETEEQRKERRRIRHEKDRATRRTKKLQEGKKRSETEDQDKQCLATLKRLKRGDENEMERKVRLEKVVTSKQLRLAMETEEARLENETATKWLRFTKKRKKNFDLIWIEIGVFKKQKISRNELTRPVMGTIFLVSGGKRGNPYRNDKVVTRLWSPCNLVTTLLQPCHNLVTTL